MSIAGITDHPESCWMEQMARNATLKGWGFLPSRRYLFDDRDAKFSETRCQPSGVKAPETAVTPSESERIRGALGALGEGGMPLQVGALGGGSAAESAGRIRRTFSRREESSGQREGALVSQLRAASNGSGRVRCQERLGGLLKYYHREAA